MTSCRPGHNSFVVDENGKQLIVYHARPQEHLNKACGTYCDESLYDPCRHARIREVSFDENDLPKIKSDKEISHEKSL